ncbi:MAG: substrate-binding domain-containing protein [Anaerolineae bacterium]|nr:substrate-binding domain-containing protein [Anaerolineae bacterium]MDW8299885.1 substrate-binding domain-containing protein [Anaerolineae bacterium]
MVALSLALAGCRASLPAASPTPQTVSLRLLVDGASTPLLRDLANHFHADNALITWDILTLEPRFALAELARSEVPFAVLSYLPDPRLVAENGSLWATPIGQLGIAFVVHPSNLISNLTPSQARALLRGQVRNWAELGGADRPVQVVARPAESSESGIVQALLLGNQPITRTARLAPTSQSVLDLVRADPNSIGYVATGYISEGVRLVAFDGVLPTPEALTAGSYALRSPILVVGKAEPANDLYRAFFAWIQSPAGQQLVRRSHGALPTQ